MEEKQPVVALPGYDPELGYYLGTFSSEGRRISHYIYPTDAGCPPDLRAVLIGVKKAQAEAVETKRLSEVLAVGRRIIEVIESYLAGQGYPAEGVAFAEILARKARGIGSGIPTFQ